jgi:hypothetical protein
MVGPQALVGFVLVLALVDLVANARLDRSQRVVWGVLFLAFYRDWRTGWGFFDGLPLGAVGYLLFAPGAAGRRSLTWLVLAARERLPAGRSPEPPTSRPHLPPRTRRRAST